MANGMNVFITNYKENNPIKIFMIKLCTYGVIGHSKLIEIFLDLFTFCKNCFY